MSETSPVVLRLYILPRKKSQVLVPLWNYSTLVLILMIATEKFINKLVFYQKQPHGTLLYWHSVMIWTISFGFGGGVCRTPALKTRAGCVAAGDPEQAAARGSVSPAGTSSFCVFTVTEKGFLFTIVFINRKQMYQRQWKALKCFYSNLPLRKELGGSASLGTCSHNSGALHSWKMFGWVVWSFSGLI